MKKILQLSLLALAVSISVAACKGKKTANALDSAKVDSTTIVKNSSSTTVKVDSSKRPADTSKMKDTISKTTTSTEVKKTVIKKHK